MELVDKIMKLGEMGFSKKEIAALLHVGDKVGELEVVIDGNPNIGIVHDFAIKRTKQNLEDIPSIEEVSTSEKVDEKPIEQKVPQDKDETIERLSSIEETLKAMQKENIMKSNMPTVEEKTELDIVQEILGGIKPNGNE